MFEKNKQMTREKKVSQNEYDAKNRRMPYFPSCRKTKIKNSQKIALTSSQCV